ncbi:MAG: response regulator transcription factor [Deltaproteobacteria bacterium]|nr:response regulator transcription factor [Deltaproteobacteria bacterium]
MPPDRSERDLTASPYWFLLEDDPQVSMALARFLGQYAPVRHATTLGESEALLSNIHRCCGVLLDVDLPDGSGLDVLENLRRKEIRVPALVLTAHSKHEHISRAQRLGAQFLWKPWSQDNLQAFVDQAMRQPSFRQDFERCLGEWSEQHQLSPRETELVRHVSSGIALKEIPDVMSISQNSTKTMVRRILLKSQATAIGDVTRQLYRRMLGPSGQAPTRTARTPGSV